MPLRKTFDQLNSEIEFQFPPQRIISLVPSQTEFLFSIGLAQQVVGVTKFCIHPPECRQKEVVGGTKDFNFDVIDSLNADLIIGNKEENYREGIDRLKERYPVWMSDIFTLDDALRMMRNVGDITGRAEQANAVIIEVEREFATLRTADHRRVVYLIWRKPWMAAGQHTFIHDMLSRNGLRNAIMTDRYPSLTLHDLSELRPDLVLLSSEPFPFTKKHIEELRAVLPNAKFMLVDGEMFSWYGSRLRFACDYFKTLFSSSSHQQIADHSSS